jgi:hypothetical protein
MSFRPRSRWCRAFARIAAVGAGAAFIGAGCSTPLARIGQSCSINSDCNSPLICAFQRCHNACKESRDCPAGERCVPAGSNYACQLPDESGCVARPCVGGQLCGSDQQCRAPCGASSSCATGQTCLSAAVASGACFDPYNPVDLVNLGGGDSGITQAGGADAAPGAGGTVTTDAGALMPADGPLDQTTVFLPDADAGGGLGFNPANVDVTALDAGTSVNAGIFAGARNVVNDANWPGPTTITQNDVNATPADLIILNSWKIDTAFAWDVSGTNGRPIIILVRTTVEILGQVLVNALGVTPGPGGYGSNCMNLGLGGGGPGMPPNRAGGGSYCGSGGHGGTMSGPAASGGATYGNATLIPLLGGSASGSSASNVCNSGGGGGAIQIVAGQSITIGAYGAISAGGGAGGGSGGAILLEAPLVTIRGTLAANGGSDVSNATANARPALGSERGGLMVGGNGSAGGVVNGGDGMPVASNGVTSIGNGGGGAGRIRINTANGGANITSGAVISPDLTTGCATQGTLGQRM